MRGESAERIIPVIAVFTVALARLKGCMRDIMRNYTDIRHSSVSLDIVYEGLVSGLQGGSYLERKTGQKNSASNKAMFERNIQLKNICYKFYRDQLSADTK